MAAQLFAGFPLKRHNGGDASPADLEGKIVGVYFSAHWCPPCRRFTAVLKNFYNEVRGEGVEIVFVSLDHSKENMEKYLAEAHGDWLYVPYRDPNMKKLAHVAPLESIPKLIVYGLDGTIVDNNAYVTVQLMSPKAAVSKWKSAKKS